ncbi:cytochrome ubiquinol oxidase subunit I, partial [Bacillus mycoides]
SANTWMNTPAGFSMNPDGSVFNVDPWKAFFNPSFGTSAFHVVITAYATGAAVIASIAGFKLLKKNLSTREIAYHKKGLLLGLVVTFITGATMWLSGHESAIALHKHSPEKLASAEALFETTSHAPLSIGGVVDPNTLELNYALEIPNMLSLLVGLDPNTVVKG